jgi:Rieske Fe-S protein
MDRRSFFKVTAGGLLVAMSPSLITTELRAADGSLFAAFEKVQLMDMSGKPVKVGSLKKETNYVFNYPHRSTPVIILDLEDPTAKDIELSSDTGEKYIWKGGVGPDRTIVAYSAICAHQLAHPTPDDTFIQYVDKNGKTASCNHGGVMVCSSHLSAFDVGKGCKNISGPAQQPLASIILEVAEDGTIFATAVLGPDKFHEYFKQFKPELKKFYGGKRKGKKLVKDFTHVSLLTDFSKELIQY